MNRFIILLRGVNVSGKNILPMQELREMLGKLKFNNVQTYIQSGNIVLETDKDSTTVEQLIKEGIAKQWGYTISVLVKTRDEMVKAVEKNPYPTENHKILAFVFLSEAPKDSSVVIKKGDDEAYTILEDVVYLYCPSGFAKSKLSNNLFEKKLHVSATTRNYRTTMKLLAMASE